MDCCTCLEKPVSSPRGVGSKWVTEIDKGKKQSAEITSGKGLARGTSDGSWDEDSQQGRELSERVSREDSFSLSAVKSSLTPVRPPCPEAHAGISR